MTNSELIVDHLNTIKKISNRFVDEVSRTGFENIPRSKFEDFGKITIALEEAERILKEAIAEYYYGE